MAIMSHLVPDAADIEDNSFVQLPRLLDDERVWRLGLKLLQCHDVTKVKLLWQTRMWWKGRSGRMEDILKLNCTSGRRGVPEWGDPGSLKQKENIKEKARWLWLLLENAKQETRIIRIASVTITSPGIMMMGRNLSQARDRLLGIFQKTSPSLPRLFFTSLPPPRFVHCRSQRFSPKRRLCSPSAQRPLWKLQSDPVHNAPAVNKKLLKIEQAQTDLKWSILSCDFQKYLS